MRKPMNRSCVPSGARWMHNGVLFELSQSSRRKPGSKDLQQSVERVGKTSIQRLSFSQETAKCIRRRDSVMSNQILKDLFGFMGFSAPVPTAVFHEHVVQDRLKSTHRVSIFPRPLLQQSQQVRRRNPEPFLNFWLSNDGVIFFVVPSVLSHLILQVLFKLASSCRFIAATSKIA